KDPARQEPHPPLFPGPDHLKEVIPFATRRRRHYTKSRMSQSPVQRAAELALQHHQSGRLREAESLYRQVLASQPAFADVLTSLGALLHQTGRNDEALRLIDRSIQINPRSSVFFNNQGLVLIAQQRLDEAEVAYRKATMLQPDYADAVYSLAWILQQKE